MTTPIHRNSRRLMGPSSLVIVALFMTAASGQTTSITDGKTPTGLTPGTPAGSYALSGFENVNLFNGNLNFHLPLLNIGGRGSAGYTMTLAIEQKWIIKKGQPNPFGTTPLTPNPNWWQGKKPGYSPGVLHGRRTGYGEYPYENYCGYVPNVHDQTLTRLTFTGADGTEYDLRDQLTNGAPGDVSAVPCNQTGTSRGTVFIAADGSATTFISDATIYDYKWLDINISNRLFYPSGYLMLKDGTRYRIDSGAVSWIRDRNGNKVSIGATTITDSLNRNVTVALNSGSGYDEISYKGFPGAAGGARKIRVWYASLGSVLRPNSGYSLQTYYQLFPLNSASTSTNYNPSRVSKVELPDGRFYKFYYNPYGELARVVLPTGGAFEYDWSGVTDPTDEVIFRYVTERRVYLVSGGTLQSKTQYNNGEVKTFDAANNLVAYSLHYFEGSAYFSMVEDAGLPSAINFSPWQEGREYRTEMFDIVSGTPVLKRRIDHTWQQPVAGSTWPLGQAETSWLAKPNNPQITQTVTTLSDTNQVTKQTFLYDRYSNRTDVYEYDYGSGAAGALVRRAHADYLTTNAVNGYDYACNPSTTCGNGAIINNSIIHLRGLMAQSQVFDAGGVERSRSTYEYDKHSGTNHAGLLPRSNISGLDSLFGDVLYTPRGNVTAITSYILGTPTTNISTYAQYDVAGNVVKAIDGRGYATEADYTDCFGSPDGNARLNSAPLELSSLNQASYAFATIVINALNHRTYSQFDYQTGQPVDGEDQNGTVASGYYSDLLDRPTQIRRAPLTSLTSQTTFIYNDAARTATTTSDLNANGDNLLKSQTLYDGLGRSIESRQYESPTAFIATKQTYDALGRTSQASNPYRDGDAVLWTTTAYDALGRVITVTTPDNAVVATSYSGNTVTVTDQAGKVRRSLNDALGRLSRVDEPDANGNLGTVTAPNQPTVYSYDVLDNLTTVNQGVQTRTFVYDSLKRLKSAANPESGTINYTYDNNGNLLTKTDARPVTTTITYDALNRPTLKDYSDTTPDVAYFYDAQALPAGAPSFVRGSSTGRLVAVTTGGTSAGTYRGYNSLGQVVTQYQRTDSVNYLVEATYDAAGGMKTHVYPSVQGAGDRRTIAYTRDTTGRLASLNTSAASYAPAASVSNILYKAHNGLSSETYSNNLIHAVSYNSRLQPDQIKLGTAGNPTSIVSLTYNYGSTTNNGNVQSIAYSGGGLSYTQTFGYDQLNRLTTSQEGASWSQTNSYDRYSNRSVVGGTLAFGPSNNRITNSGYGYDLAGNLINDGAHAYTYNAENKVIKVDAVSAYVYDGEGRRVRKLINENLRFIYGIGGQQIAEVSGANGALKKEYIYGASGLVASIEPTVVNTNGTRYTTSDHLGSPRVITNSSAAVVSRHDYMPFGEELFNGGRTVGMGYGVAEGLRQKFTSKERDNETGLDYFLARYYSSTQGRFTSPDEFSGGPEQLFYFEQAARTNPTFYAELEEPQTLNKYQYAINNPLRYVDPDGHQAIADALRQTGQELGRSGHPGLMKAGEVLMVAGAAAAAASQVDWKAVGEGFAEVFKGSGPGCLAGSTCTLTYNKNNAPTEVTIDGTKHPEAARHAADAQKAGQPDTLTVDRGGAKDRRKEATSGTKPTKGKDRDEYPPAVTKEGGKGASVRPISPKDNRGAGASIGNQIKKVPDGGKIKIKIEIF